MSEYTNDAEGTQPTEQRPAQPTAQPGYQDGYQRGAQAGYEAGFHAGQTAQQPRVDAGNGAADAGRSAWGAGSVPPIPGQQPGYAPKPGDVAAPAPSGGSDPKPKREHRGAKSLILGVAGGVIGAGLLTGALLATGVIGKSGAATFDTGVNQTITINPNDESTTTATAVAAKALPSVVTVNVTTSDGEGLGSGVIYDTDGDIITNNHVIEDAESITVTIDGKSYDATLVGTDASSDIAVIKVDLQGASVTPMEIGDSSALQVGDWVMSVGSPFGLEQSVSTGIVSSLYRSTMMQSTSGNTIYTNLIQTDATINPGNSGGALVDDEGKLVGINSLIESYSGSSSGVGFAIPGNYAVEVAQKIINGETVTHAYLGGSFQTVTAQNARENNLSVNQGAYVAEVTSGSPAEQAGIRKGDIITSLDGEEITSSDGLVLAVRSHSVGDKVTVTLMRGSKQMSVDVTLGSDESMRNSEQDESSQGSLLEQYLNQYGYGNGSGNSDSRGNGFSQR